MYQKIKETADQDISDIIAQNEHEIFNDDGATKDEVQKLRKQV